MSSLESLAMKNDLVSVIIPLYNHERYVEASHEPCFLSVDKLLLASA
jgi:hypothetical protein